MSSQIPTPSDDALAHSERLRALIHAQIAEAGGAIPFWKFMELALYAPGLGYYSAGAAKFGAAGDFVTAPELGPLFAECVAEAFAPVLRELGAEAQFFEIGGGSGVFAGDALAHLAALDATPARYAILEPSADLRERQRQHLQQRLSTDLFARVDWVDGPMPGDWQGVLFANEVVDALPTPRFVIGEGEVFEEYVTRDGDGFGRTVHPADALLGSAVRHVERQRGGPLPDGYRSELLPQLPYWVQAVAGGLTRGAMLFVDYGYARREFYRDDRDAGTLRAFHRHQVTGDVFALPGLQDLTASVDFTALAEAGTHAGFEFAGYCNQTSLLLGNRLEQRLAAHEALAPDEAARYALRQQAKRLTLPGEMGEAFQAIGFAKDADFEHAFLIGDMSHRL
ncbi:class I SAM-dependent methyltransferase [Luteimonas terrae]|uniref:SAM-dependent MidA family methyltransferase n=1 Tax=Luteimonas terrae TaxID=1530191 RepID=A0ABU1XT15_9GAMM|nr:SAM-dependent methyltransferase [Luteimonas terrae]MDR7191873.1 SAM-dependent MidA family methyltransferase [Luteimonas terrae]